MLTFLVVSDALVNRQLREGAFTSARKGLVQTAAFLDYRLYEVFSDFVRLEHSEELERLFVDSRTSSDFSVLSHAVSLYNRVDETYNQNFSVLDSLLVAIQYQDGPPTIAYRSVYPPLGSDFSFDRELGGRPLLSQVDAYGWINKQQNTIFPHSYAANEVSSLYKVLQDEESGLKVLLMFNFSENFFRRLFNEARVSPDSFHAIVGNETVLTVTEDTPGVMLPSEIVAGIGQGEGPRTASFTGGDGQVYHVLWEPLFNGTWFTTMVIPEKDLRGQYPDIRLLIMILYAITLAVAFGLAYFSSRMVSLPVGRWRDKIRNVATNPAQDVFLDDAFCKEISEVNEGIGLLLDHVEDLNARNLETLKTKRELEIRVLQEQIKPHFLYNTLFAIERLAVKGDLAQAARISHALNSYYRISLSKGHQEIPVREECDLVLSFLTIHQSNHPEVSARIDIDQEVEDQLIPKLTLQPLVENSLFHGVIHGEPLLVSIHGGRNKDGDILLTVEDNGLGMPQETIDRLNSSMESGIWAPGYPGGVGLRNVHERIRLAHGTPYGLTVGNREGQGTVISVLLPFRSDTLYQLPAVNSASQPIVQGRKV